MIVNCFTITAKNNNVLIDTIYKDFGNNIPKYLQYEGGCGCTYLCCVNININVLEICEKCNYICGTIYPIEIDDNMYNNDYTINPTYSKDGEKFKLLQVRNLNVGI